MTAGSDWRILTASIDSGMTARDLEASAAYQAARDATAAFGQVYRDRYRELMDGRPLPPPPLSTSADELELLVCGLQNALWRALEG